MSSPIPDVSSAAFRDADLLSVLTEGVVVADAKGTVLYMNASALRMHGMQDPAEARQSGAEYTIGFELLTSDGRVVPFEEWPISRVMRQERFSDMRYQVVQKARNVTRVLSYSGTPVYANGTYIYALLSIHDVTEEAMTAEGLRMSEQRLRTAMSAMPHVVVIYGPDLRVQYINEHGARFLGMPADQIVGRTQAELGRPELVEHFLPLLRTAFETRQPARANAPLGEREFEVSYVPLLNRQGEVEQILGVGRDLTEQNRVIRELKSFAYAVSHDLKAPARAVTGFSQVLMDDYADILPPDAQDMLRRIAKAGLRMSALLDDLLKLSRISVDELHPREIDLVSIARRALHECAGHEHVTFHSPERITVWGDRGLMVIAIDNLIQNAVKFSSKVDRPAIEIGFETQGARRIYYVRDNGIGFDSQSAGNMFKPFYRFHDDKELSGTGIGLAIVDRVIERHGGRVWAESSPGKGACFYFTLPARPRTQKN